jgi:hypothetical protein
MDRVETLCDKLQNQIKQRATVEEMLLTVQMIQSELMHIQSSNQQIMQSHNNTVGTMQEMMKNQNDNKEVMKSVAEMMSAPKRIVRGPDGKAVGVEVVK